jgi:hypothetical protein
VDALAQRLAASGLDPSQTTHLKAYRTAASLLKKGLFLAVSGAPRAA